ncbi:cytokine receptor common subunit beta isoform 1-T4 [Pholidichthys leucotaenia]
MMSAYWVLLGSMLPHLGLFSGQNICEIQESSSSQSGSLLLESLKCYNDYESHVYCKWKRDEITPQSLWVKIKNSIKLCEPYDATDAAEMRTVHCNYKARVFGIGIEHTVFFLNNKTLDICSSGQRRSLNLSQHLKARPPVNLSTHDAGDGGQTLVWSSPYHHSSSLNKNLAYQLSYRMHRQDSWTTVDVTNCSVTLLRQQLLPGCRYEAMVRARASVGRWSDWSAVVSWHTEEDFGHFPTLHCVLDGEKNVTCSWEVSRDRAQFITYQLECRHSETTRSGSCCVNPAVSFVLNGRVLRYSCTLTVADPEHLLLDLIPTHNAKTFKTFQNIRPKPPEQVKVWKKNSNWIVGWTAPKADGGSLKLSYQVCYYRTQDQESSVLLNITEGSLTILGESLAPLQDYQVKVRSLIDPGSGHRYEGIPSIWSDPVEWKSDEAAWSFTTLGYILIGVFVTAVFFTLYCTIPACQKKVILWVESVPSPGKSKILSEIMSVTNRTLTLNEKTTICKVQHLDVISSCSSDALLWPTQEPGNQCSEQDKGPWNADHQPYTVEAFRECETSGMSFSGPYIFCQSSDSPSKSVKDKTEEKDIKTSCDVSESPPLINFTLFGEGYVCLPSHNVSRSVQDLMSRSCDDNTTTHWCGSAEKDQRCPDTTRVPVMLDTQADLCEPTSGDDPPEYSTGPFSSWPQAGSVQASGYCHLPTAFIGAVK